MGRDAMKYHGIFNKKRDVEYHFDVRLGKEVKILFAYYSYYSWTGMAFVLFEQDGKLYEVNGSHCSCYGLEGQWDPEETTVKALSMRKFDFDKAELCRVLKKWSKR